MQAPFARHRPQPTSAAHAPAPSSTLQAYCCARSPHHSVVRCASCGSTRTLAGTASRLSRRSTSPASTSLLQPRSRPACSSASRAAAVHSTGPGSAGAACRGLVVWAGACRQRWQQPQQYHSECQPLGLYPASHPQQPAAAQLINMHLTMASASSGAGRFWGDSRCGLSAPAPPSWPIPAGAAPEEATGTAMLGSAGAAPALRGESLCRPAAPAPGAAAAAGAAGGPPGWQPQGSGWLLPAAPPPPWSPAESPGVPANKGCVPPTSGQALPWPSAPTGGVLMPAATVAGAAAAAAEALASRRRNTASIGDGNLGAALPGAEPSAWPREATVGGVPARVGAPPPLAGVLASWPAAGGVRAPEEGSPSSLQTHHNNNTKANFISPRGEGGGFSSCGRGFAAVPFMPACSPWPTAGAHLLRSWGLMPLWGEGCLAAAVALEAPPPVEGCCRGGQAAELAPGPCSDGCGGGWRQCPLPTGWCGFPQADDATAVAAAAGSCKDVGPALHGSSRTGCSRLPAALPPLLPPPPLLSSCCCSQTVCLLLPACCCVCCSCCPLLPSLLPAPNDMPAISCSNRPLPPAPGLTGTGDASGDARAAAGALPPAPLPAGSPLPAAAATGAGGVAMGAASSPSPQRSCTQICCSSSGASCSGVLPPPSRLAAAVGVRLLGVRGSATGEVASRKLSSTWMLLPSMRVGIRRRLGVARLALPSRTASMAAAGGSPSGELAAGPAGGRGGGGVLATGCGCCGCGCAAARAAGGEVGRAAWG